MYTNLNDKRPSRLKTYLISARVVFFKGGIKMPGQLFFREQGSDFQDIGANVSLELYQRTLPAFELTRKNANAKMWQCQQHNLLQSREKELAQQALHLAQELNQAREYFNHLIDSLDNNDDCQTIAQYYSDYVDCIKAMLDTPSNAQTLCNEFFKDERFDDVMTTINKRQARCETVADVSGYCLVVCASVVVTTLIAAAVTGGVAIGLCALSVIGLCTSLGIHMAAKDRMPIFKDFEQDSDKPQEALSQLADFEQQHAMQLSS